MTLRSNKPSKYTRLKSRESWFAHADSRIETADDALTALRLEGKMTPELEIIAEHVRKARMSMDYAYKCDVIKLGESA